MSRFLKIGEATKILGVSIQTLRRREESGYLALARKSKGIQDTTILTSYWAKKKLSPT
jgi:predicted site-specific integrase-resolvase